LEGISRNEAFDPQHRCADRRKDIRNGQAAPPLGKPRNAIALFQAYEDVHLLHAAPDELTVALGERLPDLVTLPRRELDNAIESFADCPALVAVEGQDDVEVVGVGYQVLLPYQRQDRPEPKANIRRQLFGDPINVVICRPDVPDLFTRRPVPERSPDAVVVPVQVHRLQNLLGDSPTDIRQHVRWQPRRLQALLGFPSLPRHHQGYDFGKEVPRSRVLRADRTACADGGPDL